MCDIYTRTGNTTFLFHVAVTVKPECCTFNHGQVLQQNHWENVEYSLNFMLQTLEVTGYTCNLSRLLSHNNLVCEIPKSFELSSPSNFRTQGSFIDINSGKIFERDLLSSDSVAKSATQKPWVF